MVYESPAGGHCEPWSIAAALGSGLRTSFDLTTSKNSAQATFGVTADPSFQQVMAAVPPPAGHG
jgi:hypothetical protein